MHISGKVIADTLKAIGKIEAAYGNSLSALLGSSSYKLPDSEEGTTLGSAWTRYRDLIYLFTISNATISILHAYLPLFF